MTPGTMNILTWIAEIAALLVLSLRDLSVLPTRFGFSVLLLMAFGILEKRRSNRLAWQI